MISLGLLNECISIHLEKLAVKDTTTSVDQIVLNLWHTQTHNTGKSYI